MNILAELKKIETDLSPTANWQELLLKSCAFDIRLNESLAKYTSLKVGGLAEALCIPADLQELQAILAFAAENRIPWIAIGSGSNLLVKDSGVAGIVIKLNKALNFFEVLAQDSDSFLFKVGAGYSLAKLVDYACKSGYSGMEYLYGIPASVGGALCMNAGSKKQEIAAWVESIEVIDFVTAKTKKLKKQQLDFSYRHLKLPKKYLIISATLKLKAGDAAIQERLQEYRAYRQETQPLNYPSLGSVFKNPQRAFAAQLIEECGLKGVRVGNARISDKHSNWIVNEGGASAKDVLALIHLAKDKVQEKTGYKLELEAKVIGRE